MELNARATHSVYNIHAESPSGIQIITAVTEGSSCNINYTVSFSWDFCIVKLNSKLSTFEFPSVSEASV